MLTGLEVGKLNSKMIVTPTMGPWSGKPLGLSFLVCPSPTCRCCDVRITLHDENDGKIGEVLVDVFENRLVPASENMTVPLEPALAKEFIANFDAEDWKVLAQRFYTEKRRVTENLRLQDTATFFSMAEIEMNGEMVAHEEILPYGERLEVSVGGESFWLDDHYCVKSDCDCTNALLVFVATDEQQKNGAKPGEHHAIHLDCRTGKFETETKGNTTQKEPTDLFNLFLEKYPNLLNMLNRRRKQLIELYAEFRKKHPAQRPAVSTKIGRNDPCPCGSGKKYKKCCA